MYTKFLTTTLLAAILSMLVATTTMTTPIGAQEGNEFSANLSGEDEVPPTESSANGTAKFQVNDDDTQLSYLIEISGLKQVDQAHIHSGPAGENGEVVVTLAEDEAAEDQDNPEIELSGNITEGDLQGDLEGKQISDLLSLINNGSAYVKVHTPAYPDGAIRGQVESGVTVMDEIAIEDENNTPSDAESTSTSSDDSSQTESD